MFIFKFCIYFFIFLRLYKKSSETQEKGRIMAKKKAPKKKPAPKKKAAPKKKPAPKKK